MKWRGSIVSAATALSLAAVLAACGGGTSSPISTAHDGASSGAAPVAAPALKLVSVSATKKLRAAEPITLTFSSALAASTPKPTLKPYVRGKWTVSDTTATFKPAGAYPPDGAVQLTVPNGSTGVTASDGGYLRRAKTMTLKTPTASVVFAQQILARLGYLPLKTSAAKPATAAAEAKAVFHAPHGSFSWKYGNTPASLKALWDPKGPNTILRGAILDFQHQADLTADELLGQHTWAALLHADEANSKDDEPYSYIYANLEERPQTLTVWRAGATVITSPVNGGVPGALTPVGTFPIYERLTSTTMSGTNPDGSHYSDPGVKWVNYFSGGSAVHGFPRDAYGYPQSVGCLELPIATAARVFPLVGYGTLVTVSNDVSPTDDTGSPASPTTSSTPTTSASASSTPSSTPTPTATATKSKKH